MLRAIARTLAVTFGFLLAAIASAMILVTLGLERFVHERAATSPTGFEELDGVVSFFEQVTFLGTMASGFSIVPALLVVIIGEVASISSSLYYVLAGGAALAVMPLLSTLLDPESTRIASTTLYQVLATAGFGGGFVYWLIAGRNA